MAQADGVVVMPPEYDPRDWRAAMDQADLWGDQIPIGVRYEETRPTYQDRLECMAPSGGQPSTCDNREILREIMLRHA